MFGKETQHNSIITALRNVAYRHGMTIRNPKVMSDHVHMLVTLPRSMTDLRALVLLKGGSAFLFVKHHEKSRLRLSQGHLWSAGGCATTVGYNELSTVENYIEHQEEHHAVA